MKYKGPRWRGSRSRVAEPSLPHEECPSTAWCPGKNYSCLAKGRTLSEWIRKRHMRKTELEFRNKENQTLQCAFSSPLSLCLAISYLNHMWYEGLCGIKFVRRLALCLTQRFQYCSFHVHLQRRRQPPLRQRFVFPAFWFFVFHFCH